MGKLRPPAPFAKRLPEMPTYELVVLLKNAPVQQLKEALKRTAHSLFENGAVIRKIENLGFRPTPYKIKLNKELHYFVMQFDSSERQLFEVRDSLRRDLELVRKRIIFVKDKLRILDDKYHECDIYLDMLEVPLRPHVQKMVEISKKKERKPFHYGGGRNYDPLSR